MVEQRRNIPIQSDVENEWTEVAGRMEHVEIPLRNNLVENRLAELKYLLLKINQKINRP